MKIKKTYTVIGLKNDVVPDKDQKDALSEVNF